MELQSSEVASLSRKFKIMSVIAVVVYCSEAKQQKLILGHVSFQSKDCNFGDGRRMIYLNVALVHNGPHFGYMAN